MNDPVPSRLGRRGFLGYLGSAAAGAAVSGGVVAAALGGDPAPTGSPPGAAQPGRTIAPYGEHQVGITSPAAKFVELVALDLVPGLGRAALGRLMRLWTGDIEALATGRPAPGDRAPWLASGNADLTVTVGLGPGAFAGGRFGPRPAGLRSVPPMRHDRLEEWWSGGDLVLLVAGNDGTTVAHAVRRLVADAKPFATLRWRQSGFWNALDQTGEPMTGRNLFGQVDGSGNPRIGTDLFDETVWMTDGAWAGGTTLVVRRIRMDLETWDLLTRDEQERSMGRNLADGAPLSGGQELDALDPLARREGRLVVAADAHARRAHPTLNGGARIFRKGANYVREADATSGGAVESGLLFTSYQADVGRQFVPIQQSLDQVDALNRWTTAIGSAWFAILPGFEEGGWLGEGLLAR